MFASLFGFAVLLFARRAGSGSGASQIPFWSALDLSLSLSQQKGKNDIGREKSRPSNYSSPL
jgi:hypothetical protein